MRFGSQPSGEEKRARLRRDLASGRLLSFPGAFSPLVAMMIEAAGFDGVYVSGGALSASLGFPDIGLLTLSEVSGYSHAVAQATRIPVIVDVDTGFGEAVNVARTVTELEALGLAGCQIEDQITLKRCGHLDHKSLIEPQAMVEKLRAAVTARRDRNFLLIARTDARSVEGIDAAIRRARLYVEAGADVIFPEALIDRHEFELFRRNLDAYLLANITEFGKSPLLSRQSLSELGYNIAIYPVTTLRLALKAVEDGLRKLREEGGQASLIERMMTRDRLYELLSYEEYGHFDPAIADIKKG